MQPYQSDLLEEQWGFLNRYHFDNASGTLFIYFYSELVGAEVDETIISALTDMAPMSRNNLTSMVMDFRDITEADLTDTDEARVSIFEARLQKVMGYTDAEFSGYKNWPTVTRIIDRESKPCQVFLQRLVRTSTAASVGRRHFVTSLEEAAKHSRLTIELIEENLSALS